MGMLPHCMLAVLLQTLPFFALIGLGYGAAKTRFFPEEAAGILTKFVFYFALSAMLFRFTANLSIDEIFDPQLAGAYLLGTALVWMLGFLVALRRREKFDVAAIEAQCAAIGNTGFLGVPMLTLIMGAEAVAPNILVLSIDLIVFSSLLTLIVTGARGDQGGLRVVWGLIRGLIENPMIVSIALGLAVSASGFGLPVVADTFLGTLGAAATPCALFAIGTSIASKSAESVGVAGWLSFAKLVLHPAAVALAALLFFTVDPFKIAVVIAAASLPVAGNVFILAQHYGVAPKRVSASILISTVCSILTVSAVIALVT